MQMLMRKRCWSILWHKPVTIVFEWCVHSKKLPLQYRYRINLFCSFGFWVFRVFDSHRNYRSTRVHWGFFFGGGAEWLNSELAGVVPRYLPSDRKRTAGWIKAFILIDEPCAILQNLVDKTTRLKRWIQQSTCCYFSITWVKRSLNACELSLRAHFLFKKIQNRNMRIV